VPKLPILESSSAFPSPCDLDRAIQHELTALATIKADHRSACRWLDEWSAPEGLKEGLACRLDVRHRTEREAHVLRLAELHQKRMLLTASDAVEHTGVVSDGFGAGQGRSKLPRRFPPVWMVSPPDHGRARPTVTAQTGGPVRTGYKDRR
jgi:hypothetical protein